MLQALIDKSQEHVDGHGAAQALQGQCHRGRPHSRRKSLYSMQHVTFEDDAGAYDQQDAEGFIKLNALRLRLAAEAGAARLPVRLKRRGHANRPYFRLRSSTDRLFRWEIRRR